MTEDLTMSDVPPADSSPNRSKPPLGIRCPRCPAAPVMGVYYVRPRAGLVRRVRRCAACGYRRPTVERLG